MNFHRAIYGSTFLALCVGMAGCRGTTRSDSLDTSDIVATFTVTDDGYGSVYTEARLEARTANNDNWVKLVSGDTLTATFGKQSSELTEVGSGLYQAAFSLSNAADMTITFDRTKFDDAPDSFGFMPEALDLGGFEGAIISRGSDFIVIELPATESDKSVTISGSCVNTLTFDIGRDGGDVTVYPGDLYSSDSLAECDVTMTLTTTMYGEADPAFHPDSSFVLTRERATTFYSIP